MTHLNIFMYVFFCIIMHLHRIYLLMFGPLLDGIDAKTFDWSLLQPSGTSGVPTIISPATTGNAYTNISIVMENAIVRMEVMKETAVLSVQLWTPIVALPIVILKEVVSAARTHKITINNYFCVSLQ